MMNQSFFYFGYLLKVSRNIRLNFKLKYSNASTHRIIFICLLFCSFQIGIAQENCSNGIDDDNDGLIDLNDIIDCDCAGLGSGVGVIPSLIPNASFELYDYIPNSFSQMDACTGWMQATDATSDYFYAPSYDFGAVTSLGLTPPPDGNGYVGTIIYNEQSLWIEYIGACLSTPLIAGTNYQLTFNIAALPIDNFGNTCNGGIIGATNIDIIIYGNASCAQMPVPTTDCPSSANTGWMELGSVNYTPNTSWGNLTISFTATTNIYAIILGGPCSTNIPPGFYDAFGTDAFGTDCYPYFLFDNLILNKTALFTPVFIDSDGAYCSENLVLEVSSTLIGGIWQWYKDGIALVGQTSSTIFPNSFGIGTYTATYTLDDNCGLAEIMVVNDLPNAKFIYTPTEVDMDHSFVSFTNLSTGATDYEWKIDGITFNNSVNPNYIFADTGTYCITLIAANIADCLDSAKTCIEVKPVYTLYIPNSFTVNGDGLNEIFQIKGMGVKTLDARIFNRWGEEIFAFHSIDKGWNGIEKNNRVCPQGAYTYIINTTDFKNKEYTYFGKIHLLR